MKKLSNEILSHLDSLSSKEKEQLLAEIRQKVNEIDNQIVELLGERAEHSRTIGKLKSELQIPIFSLAREEEIFNQLFANIPSALTKKNLLRIYERILDEMRQIQREEIKKRK